MEIEKSVRYKNYNLAYTAGILDGEGCISLCTQPRGEKRYFDLHVSVSNTNEWLVQWLKFHYGGNVYSSKRSLLGRRIEFKWYVRGAKAADFLFLLLPYLRLKLPQAELAISFLKRRKRWARITPEEQLLMEADKIQLSKYNQNKVL